MPINLETYNEKIYNTHLACCKGVWSKRPKSETAQTKTAQIGYQNGPTFLLHNYDR